MQRSFALFVFASIVGAVMSAYSQTNSIQYKPPIYRGKPLSFYASEAQHPELRAQALRSMGSFGPEANSALPQLIAGLQDSNTDVRIAAAWAIAQVAPNSNAATVRALAQTLSDSDARVRTLAALALRQTGASAVDAVPQLIIALNDPIAIVRAPAADALGAIGPGARDAVGPLAARLMIKDEQVFVLRSVSYALGNIGPDARAALPALEQALKMVRVSYAAQLAILKIKRLPMPSY